MPSQILSGQSACTFPTPQVSDSGSLLAGLHFLYGGFYREKYADPCRRYHRRLVLGGILYRVPADSYSGGGDLRCLHRAYQTGNHKSHPCRCEFRGGVRAVRCLYRLCPDYIGKINEFSADISNASLTLGTKIVLPNSESQGKDSVDLIRDSLFSIQVKQPWLLLQYGNSDVESIGADRVENLLQPVQTKTTDRTGKKS